MQSFLTSVAGTFLSELFTSKFRPKSSKCNATASPAAPPPGTISQLEFERSLAKLREQHEKDRAEWYKTQERNIKAMEARYVQNIEQQRTATEKEIANKEKKIEKMHLLNQLESRIKDEQSKMNQIKQLSIQRGMHIESATPIVESLKKLDNDYSKMAGEIGVESEMISKFEYERESESGQHKLLVTLGATGVGKSTFCNRIIGDTSSQGNESTFSVAKDWNFDSHTAFMSKQTILLANNNTNYNNNNNNKNKLMIPKITIVDTPGFEDTKGRDTQHCNNLCEYLRGCGGVNAFLVFYSSAERRFTQWYKNLLFKYTELLGNAFWNNVIIVATKAENIPREKICDFKLSWCVLFYYYCCCCGGVLYI